MDTGKLKEFAQEARRQFLEQVSSKLTRVLAEGSMARRESTAAVKELEQQIAGSSRDQVIERVAYTWFNRFCALRFMDVNRYTRIGTVSPTEGFHQPEILMEAKQGHIDDDWKCDNARVLGLLDGSLPSDHPQQEAYRLLLVAVCNAYHALMPFMFEKIADYTELLLPDDLLSENSVLTATRDALTPETCQDVEVIGWLYQFYIAEKKNDVFAALKKGKKITPENIPAATQLFTPYWIVRYLVENSLGRLWILNHPHSRLIEQMDYYIRPEEPESDFLRISSPEEIKICDPACGSGHMLTYAFDLLYAIYEEQGYQATDIPRLILTHNLYGIEIDQRAGALAAFALTMKAREKYRRFLTGGKVVQPNICVLENIQIDPEDLSAYMDKVGRDLFSGGLQGVVNQWEEVDNFGSLIRPLVTDVSEVLELFRERQMGEDLFLAGVHQKVLIALRQADYLSPKYQVVVANPPYMGRKGQNANLKKYLESRFPDVKSDLFSSFVIRNLELCVFQGHIGIMCPYVWMFIGAYTDLRRHLLTEKGITSLVQLEYSGFEGATVPICAFTVENSRTPNRLATFIRLSDFTGAAQQGPRTREAITNPECGWLYRTVPTTLLEIPDAPIAYWATPTALQAFHASKSLGTSFDITCGLFTCNNDLFIRHWWEVPLDKASFGESSDSPIWTSHVKGAAGVKWYASIEHVVNFQSDGRLIREYRRERGQSYSLPGEQRYFQEGVAFPLVTSFVLSARLFTEPSTFDISANSGFAMELPLELLLSVLCSKVGRAYLAILCPTLNFTPGDVGKIPLVDDAVKQQDALVGLAKSCVELSRQVHIKYETDWEFQESPTLTNREQLLANAYLEKRQQGRKLIARMAGLETDVNALLIAAYGLGHELSPTVLSSDVTLPNNPEFIYDDDKSESELEALLLADTMREFISYAVGCMFGRYSLDKPGLILANQGETADDYRRIVGRGQWAEGSHDGSDSLPTTDCLPLTFEPDEDNVIPLLDGDWFTDDISERFKEFLKVTFGTEHYEENLTFLENALYSDNLTGKKRKTIRDYFLKDFYNHHIKLYKKRPIYWLFSSPKGTFNALIYMHRYRPDTVSVVLNNYLREFHTKLTAKVDHLQAVANSASASTTEKAKALKEITKLKKDLKELEDYEHNVLYPLATRQIEIDLDDGVKVNYNKFGKALKKVPGLSK